MSILAKPLVRLYRMEDEEMQTRAQTEHANLVIDLAAFTAKFPWLDTAYAASFQTDITTAVNFELDNEVKDIIKVLTEDLEASVAEGAAALSTLNGYALITYPDSRAKQRVFGQDNWEKARNDQQKMFHALKQAHSRANEAPYKAALMAMGLTQPDIDNLDTIADNILMKDGLQEAAMSGRPITTEDRINVNNVVWARQRVIHTCAQLVWRDDAAKRALYNLYPPGTAAPSAIRQANLAIGETATIDLDGIEETPETTVTVEMQATTASFFFSATENGSPLGNTWTKAPGSVTLAIADFKTLTGFSNLPGPLFLVVQNTGSGSGHYKLTFHNLAE